MMPLASNDWYYCWPDDKKERLTHQERHMAKAYRDRPYLRLLRNSAKAQRQKKHR